MLLQQLQRMIRTVFNQMTMLLMESDALSDVSSNGNNSKNTSANGSAVSPSTVKMRR